MIYVPSSYRPEVLTENAIYPTSPSAQSGGLYQTNSPCEIRIPKSLSNSDHRDCYMLWLPPILPRSFILQSPVRPAPAIQSHLPALAPEGGSGEPWASKCCGGATGNPPGRNQGWSFTFPSSFWLSFPSFTDFILRRTQLQDPLE